MSMHTTGLANLEKALAQLGKNAGFNALTGALRDASKPIIKATRQAAPKKSGKLQRGIKSQAFKGKGKRVSVATLQIGFDRKTAWYGRFFEKGAKAHRIPSETVGRGRNKRQNKAKVAFGGKVFAKVQHPGMRAKPILEPAFSASYRQALPIFKQRLRERIIIEAVKKYGRNR